MIVFLKNTKKMNEQSISWIENNTINYNKINNIVKQYPNGITSEQFIEIYNREKQQGLTVETLKYIINTTMRAKNTFHNVLTIIYNDGLLIPKNENYLEEINRLKNENQILHQHQRARRLDGH
jgi:hypothetical protein